ncbi:MAG: hypothetical protein KatS3mg076_2900 [Candidatus Binatia bacterium]|nr:MAG: hypothetical protein KatS3mg076_2900 [Candidatus Binatia bacterium]
MAALSLLLALAALALLGVVLALLVAPLRAPLRRAWERRRLGSAFRRLERGDAYLRRGELERALREFSSAFFLGVVRSDRRTLADVGRLHGALLGRLAAIADRAQAGPVRSLGLAKIERLLAEREQLQRRLLALREQGRTDGQARELAARLARNRREFGSGLRQFAAEVRAARRERLH